MRGIARICLAMVLVWIVGCDGGATGGAPIALSSSGLTTLHDDFSIKSAAWHVITGQWDFTDGVIRQTSVSDDFPLILRQDKQYGDLDISVSFKPLSGRVDASGGLVFRAVDGENYYIVRANSLEGNFRLYTFMNGRRHQIASARIEPPLLGTFHHIRVVAKGDHFQAYLNGTLLLDHYDQSFARGYIGLWTKADSVTEFDHLQVVAKQE